MFLLPRFSSGVPLFNGRIWRREIQKTLHSTPTRQSPVSSSARRKGVAEKILTSLGASDILYTIPKAEKPCW